MNHSDRVLSELDLEFFRANNYVAIDNCIPRGLAERWTRDALASRGIDLDDRTTWLGDGIHFLHRISESTRIVELRDLMPRAWRAACELVGGEERIDTPAVVCDSLVMNFCLGADAPYVNPSAHAVGWHVDGDYNHFLDSPECGLLLLINFTDVHERGGATWIAPDSIAPAARTLLEHPGGLSACVLNRDFNPHSRCRRFVPLTGPAGRVFLMHPLMLHTVSRNPLRLPRAIRNNHLNLRQPMRFDPDSRPLSEVERATLAALGLDRLDFTAPAAALRHPTDHDTGAPRPIPVPATLEERRRAITLDAAGLARLVTPVGEPIPA